MHVVFDDNLLPMKDSCDDDDVGILQSNGGEPSSKVNEMSTKEEAQDPPLEVLKDMSLEEREVFYPRELNYVTGGEILGDPSKGEELNQFDRSKVWTLVERPNDKSTIGTKWGFRNKLDESGNIVRNKARLVAQGYTQEERIDFDETYAPVARMEAIRMLLAFACHHELKLFQMDRCQKNDDIFINQAKYIKEKLKKFGLENLKPQATPMSSSTKLDKDEEAKMTFWCIRYWYWMNQYRYPLMCTDSSSTRIGTRVPILDHELVSMAPKTKRPQSGAFSSGHNAQPNLTDPESIANHLSLKNDGISDEATIFPNLHPPGSSASVLDAHDRFLHLMVTWFFLLSGGKWSTIRGIDAFWSHCFRNNISINLAQIIFSDMVYIVNHRHTNLVKSISYATVLSHVFLKEQVDCSVDLALPLTDPIDYKSLRKSKFHLVQGEWVRDPNLLNVEGDDVAPP
ncbi:hypothetical protein V6N12_009403 [Hibiscus sabdariffa]|uniref:Reverse transcriptase Ty1/copia-type domain-containing protein n=1 Tax=Hibiscus sabdariffa TaxID=183260 RepID=A0ABR2EB53_9ROSI